jgi:hypothetical protein
LRRALPFILIFAIAIVARVAVFRGFAGSDDAGYARIAYDVSRGVFPPSEAGVHPAYPTRLGIAVPVGLLFRLFGVHEWAQLIFPALMSAASLVLAYALGRAFFSHRAGLIAMLLYAVLPVDCQFATWLLTDVPAAFWAGLGMLALFLGSRAGTGGRKAAVGIIAAACFGASWVTRAQVAQLAPFVLGALVFWTVKDRRNAWMAATLALGVAAVLAGEGLLYLRTRGDFLYTFHAAERDYAAAAPWYFTEGGLYGWAPGHYAAGLARRLLKAGPAAVFLNSGFALAPLVALIAAAHARVWRRREFLFPAAWFLWAAFIFNFGSASLHHYQPLPWSDAYIVPVLLPAVVLAGGWLAWMLFAPTGDKALRAERRFWAAAACAAIVLAALFGLYQRAREGVGAKEARGAAEFLRADLQENPAFVLYSDPTTIKTLEFFCAYHFQNPPRDFSNAPLGAIPAGARVLVNPRAIHSMGDGGYVPPAYVEQPPPNWRAVKDFDGAKLYVVGP